MTAAKKRVRSKIKELYWPLLITLHVLFVLLVCHDIPVENVAKYWYVVKLDIILDVMIFDKVNFY